MKEQEKQWEECKKTVQIITERLLSIQISLGEVIQKDRILFYLLLFLPDLNNNSLKMLYNIYEVSST